MTFLWMQHFDTVRTTCASSLNSHVHLCYRNEGDRVADAMPSEANKASLWLPRLSCRPCQHLWEEISTLGLRVEKLLQPDIRVSAIFCFESRKLDLQLLPSKIQWLNKSINRKGVPIVGLLSKCVKVKTQPLPQDLPLWHRSPRTGRMLERC